MIGVDTNVLVRYIVQDDPAQGAAAAAVLDQRTASDPAFVTLVTLCELFWVLTGAYGFSRSEVLSALQTLLASPEVVVESETVARQAVLLASDGADFAEAIIRECAVKGGCEAVVTFDRRAARRAGMTLLTTVP